MSETDNLIPHVFTWLRGHDMPYRSIKSTYQHPICRTIRNLLQVQCAAGSLLERCGIA